MIFRQYLKLIIFFIVISFSHKTIASNKNEAYEIRNYCLKAGGSWRQFNNSCANNCSENKFNVCSQILIFACDCGINSCWHQSKCIKNTEYNKLLTAEPKKEPNKLEKKEIEKNEQDGIYTRKKIMFKIIDQSIPRAQSINDITPKSIAKKTKTTDGTSPSENNTNNNPTNNNSENDNSGFAFFDDSKNSKPIIKSGNNLKDIYRKIGIIDSNTTEPVKEKKESNITDSIGSIFDNKETTAKESKNDENKTAENNSKEETKKSSGLLSLLSIDEDKSKNKLEIPPPPLFNDNKKQPEKQPENKTNPEVKTTETKNITENKAKTDAEKENNKLPAK
ncbi:MAG: hypothetical protein LW595_04450 [Rickettsiales bacterium]|nr:hypothetical protein [Rickettsiales bacterium]